MTGPELRAHREALGLTQRELGKLLGHSQAHVVKLERGCHGRACTPDPDRPVPADIAARVRAMRPARDSVLRRTAEEERIRGCIERGECPFCGRLGWKMLARHTAAAHGVDRFALREMAALPLDSSICAREHSEHIRETRTEHLRAIAPAGAAAAGRAVKGARIPHTRGGAVARAEANRRRQK